MCYFSWRFITSGENLMRQISKLIESDSFVVFLWPLFLNNASNFVSIAEKRDNNCKLFVLPLSNLTRICIMTDK